MAVVGVVVVGGRLCVCVVCVCWGGGGVSASPFICFYIRQAFDNLRPQAYGNVYLFMFLTLQKKIK